MSVKIYLESSTLSGQEQFQHLRTWERSLQVLYFVQCLLYFWKCCFDFSKCKDEWGKDITNISLFSNVNPSGSPVLAQWLDSWHAALLSPHRRAVMPSVRTLSFPFCVGSGPTCCTGCLETGWPYDKELNPVFVGSGLGRFRLCCYTGGFRESIGVQRGVHRLLLPLLLPRSLHWGGSVLLVLYLSAEFAFILKLQVYYIFV